MAFDETLDAADLARVAAMPRVVQTIVRLYRAGCPQAEIGRTVGMTQQAVSSRLASVRRILTFRREHPGRDPARMYAELSAYLSSPKKVAIVIDYLTSGSQSVTAARFGVRQTTVAFHLHTATAALRAHGTPDAVYYAEQIARVRQHHPLTAGTQRQVAHRYWQGVRGRRTHENEEVPL